MTEAEKRLRNAAEGLLRIKAAVVILCGQAVEKAATHHDADVYDAHAVYVDKYARFCINHPLDKPWMPNAWLWLAARCWKMGKVARDILTDPRDGLPEHEAKIVMDAVAPVRKGQWSPAQANVIRKALRGEMPPALWNMAQGWRGEFAKIDHTKTAGTILVEDPGSGETRESEPLSEEERKVPHEQHESLIVVPGADVPTPKVRKRKVRIRVRKPKGK